MKRFGSVIARSTCDQAIQSVLATLDCFASLAMTVLSSDATLAGCTHARSPLPKR
jgi:hypothetical protein